MKTKLEEDWFTINDDPIDLIESLEPYKDDDKDLVVHIGTDAQAFGPGTADYVTCVIIHKIKEDGRSHSRVFYHKDKKVKTPNLWTKLYTETMSSIQVAMEVSDAIDGLRDNIVVHVDANPNKKYASNNYVQQLAGMVVGFGFKHLLKPDSWASSHAADHIVKNKNKK